MSYFRRGRAVVLLIDVDSQYSWNAEESVPLAAMGDIGTITHVDEHTFADVKNNDGMLQAAVSPDKEPGLRLNMLLEHIRLLPLIVPQGNGWSSYAGQYGLRLVDTGADFYELQVVLDKYHGAMVGPSDRWHVLKSRPTKLFLTAAPLEIREFIAHAWAHFWKGLEDANAHH